jgi:DNA repair exonuclease SbcCD ATPase subunit
MKLRELLGSKKAASADELQSALDEIEARNTELASKKAETEGLLHAARIENAFGDNGEKVRALREELDALTEKIQALDLVAADLNEKLAGARERERGERLVQIDRDIEDLFAKRAKAVTALTKELARIADTIWSIYGGTRGNLQTAIDHLDVMRINHDPVFRQAANGHKAIPRECLAATLADLREEIRTLRGE